jgi:lipid-A-disaccharide synthase
VDRRSVLILTGESSGDRAAGPLAAALKRRAPDLEVLAVGGESLRAAGAEILQDIDELGAMGFLEVLRQVPRLHHLEGRLRRLLERSPPSVVVPVDYPGFNLRIARLARARGVPVVYYIGPQVWAWGAGRVPKIAASVDRMLVVFPFELEIYRDAGVRVDYPGHPLLDGLDAAPPGTVLREGVGIENGAPVLGLLPGSRQQEIRRILPVMLEAAQRAWQRVPGLRTVVSRAESVPESELRRALERVPAGRVDVWEGSAAPVITGADFLLVTSGTATLESALHGTPLAVLYRTSPLSWFIGRRIVRIPRISLVNILAGEDLVAEFLQGEAEPVRVAEHAIGYLSDGPRREALSWRLRALRDRLGEGGTASRAAGMVLEEIR